jgi:hypothetical protein
MATIRGKVTKVFSQALAKPDKYENTHKHALQLDGKEVWYNFNNNKHDSFIVEEEGKWQVLGVGSEVKFTYEDNGDFKNANKKSLVIIDFVKGEKYGVKQASGDDNRTRQQTIDESKKDGTWKKDDSGMSTGHAFNGAMNFFTVNGKKFTDEKVIELAQQIHDITVSLKKWYAIENPTMNDYNVGNAVGNSVLNACRTVSDADDIEQQAKSNLLNIVPHILNYVKNGAKGEAAVEKEAPVKEKSPAKPKKNDVDDDLPF